MDIFELIVPSWNAVIPQDWPLEVSFEGAPDAFVPVSGQTIMIGQGTLLRDISTNWVLTGPEGLLTRMTEQGLTRKV